MTASDVPGAAVLDDLRTVGVDVQTGHPAEMVPFDATCVITHPPCGLAFPGLAAAQRRHLPVLTHGQGLAHLMTNPRNRAAPRTLIP